MINSNAESPIQINLFDLKYYSTVCPCNDTKQKTNEETCIIFMHPNIKVRK